MNCWVLAKGVYKRGQSCFILGASQFLPRLRPLKMEKSTGYNFSASVPIVEGRVTCLKFAIPDAPDAQINAAPTITRGFPSRYCLFLTDETWSSPP